MLSETFVSATMTAYQNILIEKLKCEGFIYPSLILMNENGHVNIRGLRDKYPCILFVDESIDTSDLGTSYTIRLTLRNHDEADDESIVKLIREVTHKENPGAVGYFAQCLYKPMDRKEYVTVTTNQMNLDPDTIRVFHNCFFVKGGSEKGYIMVTPYILKKPVKDEGEHFTLREESGIVSFSKSWDVPSAVLETRIQNPYV